MTAAKVFLQESFFASEKNFYKFSLTGKVPLHYDSAKDNQIK